MERSQGKTARPSPFTTKTPMEHSIALVTGTTSGLVYAAVSLLAAAKTPRWWHDSNRSSMGMFKPP